MISIEREIDYMSLKYIKKYSRKVLFLLPDIKKRSSSFVRSNQAEKS